MKKCVVVSDSFKGTVSSREICAIAQQVIPRHFPACEVVCIPVADGGEGTVDCFVQAMGAKRVGVTVTNALGEKSAAAYARLGELAIIEMAAAAGLPQVGALRCPGTATTYGVGELIAHAVDSGCRKILLGLGGSATNDCGAGMASELGFVFLDKNGNAFVPVGGTLADIEHIISPKEPFGVPVTAACDVTNPLFGADGAAYVFAPQKGANAEQVRALDLGLRHMSKILKRELGFDSDNLPGAGAAGGLGAGAAAFLNARLKSGIDIVLDESGFDELAKSADVIVTGEGIFDSQSIRGKVMSGVCKRAAKSGAAVYAVCGCASSDADPAELGIKKLFVSSDGTRTMDELLISCRSELYAAATALAQELLKCD